MRRAKSMSHSPGRCPLSRCPLSAAMSQEKPKERVKREKDHINPKVSGQDGSRVQFKIKRHAPVRKLMKASCQRQGLSMRWIRFRFDGQPVMKQTPQQSWRWTMRTPPMCSSSRRGWGGSSVASCLSREGAASRAPVPSWRRAVFAVQQCTCGQARRQADSDTEDIRQEDFALMHSASLQRRSPAFLGLSPGNFVWVKCPCEEGLGLFFFTFLFFLPPMTFSPNL